MESKIWKLLPKKNQWIMLLLAGVLLIVIALPTKSATLQMNGDAYEVSDANDTELEMRLKNILRNMKGVGEAEVMITFKDKETVEGIVVVTPSGGNALAVQNIREVVQALFSVDAHKIKVIEGNQL